MGYLMVIVAVLISVMVGLRIKNIHKPLTTVSKPATGAVTPSTNYQWSGYVASGPDNSFNYVQGEFTVPKIDCNIPNTGVAIWVGLDGMKYQAHTVGTVEQDGVQISCKGTIPTYNTWAVIFGTPNPYNYTTLAVSPGDKVFASVNFVNNKFNFILKNLTTRAPSYTSSLQCIQAICPRNSAEWIIEDNGYNILSDFHIINFSDGYAAENNSAKEPIGQFNTTKLSLVNQSATYLDNVSPLNNLGDSFSTEWVASK